MAKKKQGWLGCTLRSLPQELQLAAAQEAVQVNPVNAPSIASLPGVVTALTFGPEHLALLTSRYWGRDGVKLTVSFLSQASAALKARIVKHMNAWGEFSNVEFRDVPSGGQVRISLGRGGYWSYLGTDVLQIPQGQPTMNLEGFSSSTPESEFVRVVRHETGHAIGFPHEHLRRELVARLDPEKTIAYFRQTQGWSRQDVIQQVLTPLDESALTVVPGAAADAASIMCYQLPAAITVDGRPIQGGADIDAADRDLAARVYPKPSAPPPPPGGDALPAVLVALDAAGKELARYRR